MPIPIVSQAPNGYAGYSDPPPPADSHINNNNSYKVVQGDTLYTIAEQVYGNGALWHKIYNANLNNPAVMSPNQLHAGGTITIP